MLEFFRMAEANRNPELKDIPLVQLMEQAAIEAGHHLVYVPNLRSKTKYQVQYKRPFNSEVTAELVCRCKSDIFKYLSKREIDRSSIDSHLGWAIYNFLKTYKPEVHNTEDKIKSAVYRSVMNKVDQSQRKEIFKYSYSYVGNTMGNREGKRPRYVNTTKISHRLDDLINGGDGDDESMKYGNFVKDDTYSPDREILEEDSLSDLLDQYAETEGQKVLLKILVEAGSSGKFTLKALKSRAMDYKIILDEAREQIEITITRSKKRAMAKGLELEETTITENMIEDRVERMVKVYYRQLKEILSNKL